MGTALFLTASVLALLSGVILLGLSIADLLIASFKFWPPPKDQLWKKRLFRVLFRFMFYGLVIGSFVYLWQNGLEGLLFVNSLAIFLIIIGFSIALMATGVLGWGNAFGSKDGLRTSGIFAYSRNPIYVATWFWLVGWGLIVPEPIIRASLLCWALLYLIAVFLEERWLLREYGAAFQEYCQKVRRFI